MLMSHIEVVSELDAPRMLEMPVDDSRKKTAFGSTARMALPMRL